LGALGGTVALNLNNAQLPVISTLNLGNSTGASYSGVLAGVFNLNESGSGTQALVGANTYSGNTVISNGTLVISTLHAGNGNFTVRDGAGLSITNRGASSAAVASLTLGASTLTFQQVASTTAALFASGGALTVNGASTIVISGTNGLAAGDTYPLVSAGSIGGTGSFSLSIPTGITANLVTNGSTLALSVTAIAPSVNLNAPQMQVSVSGSAMHLAWPTNLGWTLLTNSVSLTATNQWFPYPGSASVTNVAIPLNPAKTNVFFRMAYPYP